MISITPFTGRLYMSENTVRNNQNERTIQKIEELKHAFQNKTENNPFHNLEVEQTSPINTNLLIRHDNTHVYRRIEAKDISLNYLIDNYKKMLKAFDYEKKQVAMNEKHKLEKENLQKRYDIERANEKVDIITMNPAGKK